jgi:hypothetical protein
LKYISIKLILIEIYEYISNVCRTRSEWSI